MTSPPKSNFVDGRAVLCFVVGPTSDTPSLIERVSSVVTAGVDWLQLRDRDLEAGELLGWCQEITDAARRTAATTGHRLRVIVNRRVDIALAIGADGVHLGFDALPVAETRKLVGPDNVIGVSTHHPDEAARERGAGANYAHLAPIFDPFSKPATRPALGLESLRAACASGLPILAQGGLNASRCTKVRRAGALGVAVTGTLLHAPDPAETTRELRDALDSTASESA